MYIEDYFGNDDTRLNNFFKYMDEYYNLPEEEVRSLFNEKIKSKEDGNKFYTIVSILNKHVKDFADVTDDKLKRKVGHVLLKKLDYSNFSPNESIGQMHDRLRNLFESTSDKGINIYKILYCTVLTEGNLKKDRETGQVNIYDKPRNFNEIYKELKEALALTDEETVNCFERCSSLISKGISTKIKKNIEILSRISISDKLIKNKYYLFSEQDVKDAIKTNLSLLFLSKEKIQSSYACAEGLLTETIKQSVSNYLNKHSKSADGIGYDVIHHFTKSIFKQNLELFFIKPEEMQKKQKLIEYIDKTFDGRFSDSLKDMTSEPINIQIINAMPYDSIKENSIENISKLVSLNLTDEQISKYISNNPYVLALDSIGFANVIDEVLDMEKIDNKNYINRFLETGRSLFNSSLDFKFDTVIDKIKNKDKLELLDVDDMSTKDAFAKFVELFYSKDAEDIKEFSKVYENVIGEERESIKSSMSSTGKEIKKLSAILKDENMSIKKKKGVILKLASDISEILDRNLELYQPKYKGIETIKEVQDKFRYRVENVISDMTLRYNDKSKSVSKRYTNIDKLFGKAVKHLNIYLDSEKVLSNEFKNSIFDNFKNVVIDTYPDYEVENRLFVQDTHVKVDDKQVRGALKKVNDEIQKADLPAEESFLKFDK